MEISGLPITTFLALVVGTTIVIAILQALLNSTKGHGKTTPKQKARQKPLGLSDAVPLNVSARTVGRAVVAPPEHPFTRERIDASTISVIETPATPVTTKRAPIAMGPVAEPDAAGPTLVAEVVAEPVATPAAKTVKPLPESLAEIIVPADPVFARPVRVATSPRPAEVPAPESSTALVLPAVTVDALLWEKLLAAPTQAELQAASAPSYQRMIDFEPQLEVVRVNRHQTPVGMIGESVLKATVNRIDEFTGLVIAIGLNDPEEGVWRGEGLYQSITAFLSGALGEHDFGCRVAADEFVIVCPGKQGADAHRHLNHIADRLWDFQLRGIGAWAILFSWGGVTADKEPLGAAIACAAERMRQAKRSGRREPVRQARLRIAN